MVIPNADDRNLSCGQGPMTGIMKEMDFRILGPLQVRHSGGELDISRPFVRRAICLLTLFGVDSPLPPGQMRQMLWETGGECGRSGSLKTLIWQVRQVLTPERLVTERGGRGYRLVLDPADSVDVADFRSLTEDAEQASARGNYAKAAGIYGQALGIWREPALDDLPKRRARPGYGPGCWVSSPGRGRPPSGCNWTSGGIGRCWPSSAAGSRRNRSRRTCTAI